MFSSFVFFFLLSLTSILGVWTSFNFFWLLIYALMPWSLSLSNNSFFWVSSLHLICTLPVPVQYPVILSFCASSLITWCWENKDFLKLASSRFFGSCESSNVTISILVSSIGLVWWLKYVGSSRLPSVTRGGGYLCCVSKCVMVEARSLDSSWERYSCLIRLLGSALGWLGRISSVFQSWKFDSPFYK